MPLTGAERTKRWREKLKRERPQEYEQQRKKNLEKIKKNTKKISQLTPEEAEKRREEWRKNKRSSRQKQRRNKDLTISQNENIPGASTVQENTENNHLNVILIQKLRKKNKVLLYRYNRQMRYHSKLKTNLETYRKRFQRLQENTAKKIKDLNLEINKMKAREEILEHTLKTTYQSCSGRKEKVTLKGLIRNSANKSIITKMLGLKSKVRQKKRKLRRSSLAEIIFFFTRDDISRNTAGKKEVRTKNKEKVQIRYLLDTLVDTFKKYKSEGGRYGFTTFYLNKPFFVLSPNLSCRSTCLCMKHSNFAFLHAAMIKNGLVTGSIRDTLNKISCDINNYDCMWNKCQKCKDKQLHYENISAEKLKLNVEWLRWERKDHMYEKMENQEMKEMTTKKTVKMTKKGTLHDLIKDYENDLLAFKKHFFNMTHQQNQYKMAVNNLKDNEVVIVCDFSENYQAKLGEETQAMHYGASNLQICLHTGMVFWKDRTQSFCTLSDNTSHQPAAIWAHLTPVIEMIKRITPETTIIHFYSDGPSSQYRQKKNFYLLVHYTKKYQLQYTTWSFYEAGHGKNVADGIGGSIKRTLDRKVCFGNDIVDAKDAYKLLRRCLKVTKVFLIDSCVIENVAKDLPDKLPVLKGTMQLHQIATSQSEESFIIKYRDIGCFCGDLRGLCACFSPKSHSVVLSSDNINNSSDIRPSTSKSLTTCVEEIPQNVKGKYEVETDTCLSLKSIEMCLEPNFKINNLTSKVYKIEQDQDEGPKKIDATHELSFNSSSDLFEGLNNSIPLDLNTVDIDDLTFIENENDENLLTDKPDTKDSWQLTTFENDQVPTSSYTEIGLHENYGADLTTTSSELSDGRNLYLNLQEASNKKRSADGSHCFVDPKNVIFIKTPQVKRESEKVLTGIREVTKTLQMVIKETKVPAASTSKSLLTEKVDPVNGQAKAINKKPIVLSNRNFLKCHKCSSSILNQKGRCICCKNWFCYECMAEPNSTNNICESCLKLEGNTFSSSLFVII